MSDLVDEYERRYSKLEQIYEDALTDFTVTKRGAFTKERMDAILRAYMLKWGRMGRVLGFRGCDALGAKIRELHTVLEPFRHDRLITIELSQTSARIVDLYEEVMYTTWISAKGKVKRVGPTSTSKALHLVVPQLFMIWDRKIRQYYHFKEHGAEYFRFLSTMQHWLRELQPTIDRLQQRYNKSSVKIIDEYNWIKSRID